MELVVKIMVVLHYFAVYTAGTKKEKEKEKKRKKKSNNNNNNNRLYVLFLNGA